MSDAGRSAAGQRIRVEGPLSVRGSTPFTNVVVEMETGDVVMLEASDVVLLHELRNLDGMRCAVEGVVLPRGKTQATRIEVSRYELLPLPNGDTPVVGILVLEDGNCVLAQQDGTRYWIRGDLAPAIREYAGALVWIVGTRAEGGPDQPVRSTAFTVTGYGVIDEAPAR